MEIELGHGRYIINGCERDGKQGLLIRPSEEDHFVNEILEYDETPIIPNDDDVVIWFDNIDGARVLQSQINVAVLRMDGYEIQNAEPEARELEE